MKEKIFIFADKLKTKKMMPATNMYYRFTSDSEPTDEQLLTIMQEVRADVRRENLEIQQQMKLNFQREYENARAMFQPL